MLTVDAKNGTAVVAPHPRKEQPPKHNKKEDMGIALLCEPSIYQVQVRLKAERVTWKT